MSYKEYNESNFGEVRRKTKKREIEEAFDEELEAFVDINDDNDDEWKLFLRGM